MAKESDRIPEIAGAGRCGEPLRPRSDPRFGQRGLNIMEFCKAFNAQTQKEEKNTPISGGDHDLCRSFVHLRDEDAPDVVLSQAGRQNPVRVESPGPATRPAR